MSARPFAPRLQQADGGRAVLLDQTSSEKPRSTSAAERPPRTPQLSNVGSKITRRPWDRAGRLTTRFPASLAALSAPCR